MVSKSEQKKISKLLKSKLTIERLDGLHELKATGQEAVFAISELSNIIKKDQDDLCIINALDIVAMLTEIKSQYISIIEQAATSVRVGIKRKAEKLLSSISSRIQIESVSIEEESPLTDELFEKVEEPITESPVLTPETEVPNDFTFDLEEFSVGETKELESVQALELPAASFSPESIAPPPPTQVETPPPSPPPTAPEVLPPAEPVKSVEPPETVIEDEFPLIDLEDAPLENSLKNLLFLSQTQSSIEEPEKLAIIQIKITTVLDQLTDYLHEIMGLEKEFDQQKFLDYTFNENDIEYLRNIVLLFGSKLQDQISDKESITSLIFMGALAQKLNLVDETVIIYNLILKLDKDNKVVLNNLGMLYAKMDAIDEAIDQFQHLLKLEPLNAKIHAKIGDLFLFKKQNYDKAIEFYNKSLEIDEYLYSTAMNLAAALSKKEDFDGATSVLLKCLKINEDVPDLWLNYAILLVKQLKFHEALEAYSKALEVAPNDWKLKERAETEKEKVEKILESPKYAETKEEDLRYMVDKSSKAAIDKLFIFAQKPLDDEVFLAIFDWFKSKKHKYLIENTLKPKYGSIMNEDQFPIDPLRAKDFGEIIWPEQFDKELDLSKFHCELFDLEGYDKIVVFMEEK